MPGLGDDSVHRTYDEIAGELRRAAAKLAAPLAAAARKRRLEADKALRLERDELARLVPDGLPGSRPVAQREAEHGR